MQVDFEKDDQEIIGKLTLSFGDACPQVSEIIKEFESSAFNRSFIIEENISEIVEQCSALVTVLKKGESQTLTFVCAEAIPAHMTFEVDAEKMSAKVKVITAQGGKRLSMNDIKRSCIKEGIKFGVKKTLIKRLLKRVWQAKPGETIEQLLVKGRPPQQGEDAYIEPLVKVFSATDRQHKINDDGSFDLKDLGSIETVKEGQVVARKIEATEGVPGRDIYGTEIPAEPGNDIVITAMEGTKISETDSDVLIAIKTGILRQTDEGVQVDDVFYVDKVTAREGHIKFNGTVVVSGDVAPDMRIEATGDVLIGGYVESAIIKSFGNISISGGCSGHPLENKTDEEKELYTCQLHAKGNIHVKFASQTDIHAKHELLVDKSLTNCDITAENIIVGNPDSPMGTLVGGVTLVSKKLILGTLGNKLNQQTKVSMNRTYDVFRKKEAEMWQFKESIDTQKEQLLALFKRVVTPQDKLKLEKKLAALEDRLIKYETLRKQLIAKRNDYMSEVAVIAKRNVYPSSIVKIADKTENVHELKGSSIIKLEEGAISLQPA